MLRRIWDYFFNRKGAVDPPSKYDGGILLKKNYERREVKFFDPVSMEEKYKQSTSLKDFIQKIDTNE